MAKFSGFGGGGGMGNMQSMMKQAQQLQEKVAAAQKELEEAQITSSSGGNMVTVTLNGKKTLLSIKINPAAVDAEDVEMLEDLIIAAVNDAYKKADELYNQKMGPLTGGLGLF
jgi:DNA-binding YbaB/EbfC family protein